MDNAKQRQAVLETLYTARQAHAGKIDGGGWVAQCDLKNAHGDVAFALDVLAELGYIQRNEPPLKYFGCRCHRITGSGVVAVEVMR